MPSKKKQQFHSLYISKIVQENRHAISVYFNIPKHLQEIFDYQAGQYITLRIRILGRFILRSYSLSSCPLSDDYFRICIKRKLGGLVSGFLVDTLRVGDELEVFPPLGDFTVNTSIAHPSKNYFLYAAGSGITPIISILKCALKEKTVEKIILLYANRNRQLAIYWEELKALQQRFEGRFAFYPIFTRAGEEWEGLRKFEKSSDYRSFLQQNYGEELQDSEHFICGPTVMMQTVEKALKEELNMDSQQIHVEYFDMEQQAQETLSHRKQVQENSETLAIPTKVSQDAEVVVPAMIMLNGQPHAVPVARNETVLAACLQQNLDVPFTCESGICTTCRAKLLEGQVDMKADFALTDMEKEDGYILTCQAVPVSTKISVDFDV